MQQFRVSIRLKVLALLSSLLLIIFGVLAILFVRNTVHSQRQNLTTEAQSFAALATEPIGKTFEIYKDSGTSRIDQQVGQFTRLDPTITNVAVYDIDGQVVYKQNAQQLPNLSADQAASFDRVYIHGSGGQLTAIIQPFIEDNGVHRYGVLYLVSNSQIEHNIRQGVLAIIVIAVVTLLLTGSALFLAMNLYLLQPIRRLSQAALAISAGALDKEIPEERHDEIGDLAQSVNTMADSLKADITKLQAVDKLKSEFMTITSHNLRTPLTIINGYLETMRNMQLPENIGKMVNTIAANSTQLSNLAEDILTISELEAGHKLTGTSEPVDLLTLGSEVAGKAKQLAGEHQLQFSYKAPSTPVVVAVAAHHLRIAVWNLLDNAIKFTKPAGLVSLEVGVSGQSALIKVSDSGIGIGPDEMAKLFTKFHRGTGLMEYNYEGTGIGLYISRLLVREFGGDITVVSQQGKGSTFTISLPLATRISQPA